MRFIKRIAFVIAGVFCTALFLAVTMTASAAPTSNDAAYKAATDTDPHLPLTPYQQQMLALKKQAVANVLSGTASAATVSASSSAAAAATTSDSLSADQNPQKTSYWCGPASVNEALGQMGKWFTQAQLAQELGTTTAGTAWSGGPTSTGFPVPDVMNAHQTRNYYVPNPVSYSPSSTEVNNYKARLVYNISTVGAPLIGDAYEVMGGDHLVGHPNTNIFHWFDIRGYTNSGAYTMYEDSVHGAEDVISWAGNVPAYSTISSSRIVTIVGGRGYVW
ncbi:MAG: C39 family peptidase [Gaiellaceae bacterium]